MLSTSFIEKQLTRAFSNRLRCIKPEHPHAKIDFDIATDPLNRATALALLFGPDDLLHVPIVARAHYACRICRSVFYAMFAYQSSPELQIGALQTPYERFV